MCCMSLSAASSFSDAHFWPRVQPPEFMLRFTQRTFSIEFWKYGLAMFALLLHMEISPEGCHESLQGILLESFLHVSDFEANL